MVNNSSSCNTRDEAFCDDPLITKVKSNTNEVNFLKRPMALDLNPNNNENSTKKLKLQPTILTSPQLESFDLSQQTTLGHPISTPTPSLIPKSVTVEKEMCVQPLGEALQHNDNSNGDIQVEIPMTSSDNIKSSEYQSKPQYYVLVTSNDSSNIMPVDVIIEEPQSVTIVTSSSPPMSSTNIESQEKIKLEERRKKNRVAASNYRQRKLELDAKLEYNIKALKNENTELTTELNSLNKQLCQLKQTVDEHMQNGCEFPSVMAFNNEQG